MSVVSGGGRVVWVAWGGRRWRAGAWRGVPGRGRRQAALAPRARGVASGAASGGSSARDARARVRARHGGSVTVTRGCRGCRAGQRPGRRAVRVVRPGGAPGATPDPAGCHQLAGLSHAAALPSARPRTHATPRHGPRTDPAPAAPPDPAAVGAACSRVRALSPWPPGRGWSVCRASGGAARGAGRGAKGVERTRLIDGTEGVPPRAPPASHPPAGHRLQPRAAAPRPTQTQAAAGGSQRARGVA